MIDDSFRQILPRFTRPLVRLYARLGLSPNAVSCLGFALAAISALFILQGWALPAIGCWWLGRLLDGTDGIYARQTERATSFGAYLDIVLDMASYSLVVLALDSVHPELHVSWMWILFLYVLCIASALALGPRRPGETCRRETIGGFGSVRGLRRAGRRELPTRSSCSSRLATPAHRHLDRCARNDRDRADGPRAQAAVQLTRSRPRTHPDTGMS